MGPLALLGILLCVVFYRRADILTRFLLLTFGAMAFYFLLAGFGST
jgi:asparagine N-glycosylation enzyme membrane subunit Stt3